MEAGFSIFRRLESGEEEHIAWRPTRKLAERLVQDLAKSEPGDYSFREEMNFFLPDLIFTDPPKRPFGLN